MKRIGIDELTSGTRFSRPVYVDDEHLFVPEGVVVRQRDIDRLRKWGIDSVMTDGDPVTALSVLEQSATVISNILDQKGDSEQLSLYRQVVVQIDRLFSEIRMNRQVDKREFDPVFDRIIAATQAHAEEMIALVLRNDRAEPSLGKSAVDCSILSLVVGSSMGLDQKKLKVLGYGAALHDVGMVRVPDAIVHKKSDLNVEEIKRVRTHTLYSYKIISKDLGYPEEVGLIALQHHERWDGKGYPRKLTQKQIAVEARIVSVTDAFEAMLKEKPYRNSMIGYTAVRQLLNDNSRRFDSEILKVFIKAIGIYPLGSYVLLNNGGIGRVIKINPTAPLRPAIKMLIDPAGTKYLKQDGPIIDLFEVQDVFIAKAIDPKNALGVKNTI